MRVTGQSRRIDYGMCCQQSLMTAFATSVWICVITLLRCTKKFHKQTPIATKVSSPKISNTIYTCSRTTSTLKTAEIYIKLIRVKYRKLTPTEKTLLKWRINSRLDMMRKLERHFRLQSIISSREKKLAKDFPPDLLRI